ncbi:MAG: PLP-dependent aminotransferase family protein [Chloroflexaceae bacterium]|nr:PLP-dependent aminotransferase family protein [Chloroflexaceae bacterium]
MLNHRRSRTAFPLAALPLDPASPEPLHRQLCDRLREAILSRQLAAGTRLPGTRTMASELGVSRNTVLNAFEQLLAEGYVTGKVGAGTYVTCKLPEALLQVNTNDEPRPTLTDPRGRNLSQRGQSIASVEVCERHLPSYPCAFRPSLPAVDAFPLPLWARLVARRWRNPSIELLTYGDSGGYWPLREAIAEYLGPARGVHCQPEQVIITAGSQNALDLVARLVLDPGDAAWIEEPGYRGARSALLGAGARLVPVPVDTEGLNVAAGRALAPSARLAYVSPSHQYPTGAVMSLQRRLELLEWADHADAWIIEDDYDSEFRYAGRPISALQGLDRACRVLYVGTFSKVLLPSLRLGYLVVPADMIGAFVNACTMAHVHAPQVTQAALTDFITEGHFSHHLRRMRTLYAERQQVLLEAARQHLDGMLELRPNETGMHLVGWLPNDCDDQTVTYQALAHQVYVRPLSADYIGPPQRRGLVMGYAAVNNDDIHAGVQRLARALSAR